MLSYLNVKVKCVRVCTCDLKKKKDLRKKVDAHVKGRRDK